MDSIENESDSDFEVWISVHAGEIAKIKSARRRASFPFIHHHRPCGANTVGRYALYSCLFVLLSCCPEDYKLWAAHLFAHVIITFTVYRYWLPPPRSSNIVNYIAPAAPPHDNNIALNIFRGLSQLPSQLVGDWGAGMTTGEQNPGHPRFRH